MGVDWGLWRPYGGRLGRSGGALEVNWDALGTHWRSTGTLWGPTGGRLGRPGKLLGVDCFSDPSMLIRSTLLFGLTFLSDPQNTFHLDGMCQR